MILTHILSHNNQRIEIVVNYDPTYNEVQEIKNIWLINNGKAIKVGDLMMEFFEGAVNKIIDTVNWREGYRKTMEVAA